MSQNSNDESVKLENIPSIRQVFALNLLKLSMKVEASDSLLPAPIKKAKDKSVEVIKGEFSAFSSTFNVLQAKRMAAKAKRNPEFLATLYEEVKKNQESK